MWFGMTLNVALIIVLFTALAGASISGLLASLWEDGLNVFAAQRQTKTRGAQRSSL